MVNCQHHSNFVALRQNLEFLAWRLTVKEVNNYMVCNYIQKSISRTENIFVRNESQHNTRQTLNEVLHVLYTHSTQTMQTITYSGTRAYNSVLVNIRRCESFVTFKYRLKSHILSNNGGQFAILFAVLLLFFFSLIIEFQAWFMSIAKILDNIQSDIYISFNFKRYQLYSYHPIFVSII